MEKVNKLFVLLVAVTLMMTACNKDDEAKPKSREELLTGKSWKVTAITIDPALNGVTDIYAATPACENDDLLEFRVGGVLVVDEGATKCDPAEPQTSEGTWSLSEDKTQLNLIIGADISTITITELTETTLAGQVTQGPYILSYSFTYER